MAGATDLATVADPVRRAPIAALRLSLAKGATRRRADPLPDLGSCGASIDLPEQFLSAAAAMDKHGVWIIDTSWLTTFANKRMADMLGLTAREMIGRNPAGLIAKNDIPIAIGVMQRTLVGEPQQFEVRFLRSDGSEICLLGDSAPITDVNGEIIGALATFAEVPAIKRRGSTASTWEFAAPPPFRLPSAPGALRTAV